MEKMVAWRRKDDDTFTRFHKPYSGPGLVPDLSRLAGKPVRMHIKMRSAKLYAFQFLSDQSEKETS